MPRWQRTPEVPASGPTRSRLICSRAEGRMLERASQERLIVDERRAGLRRRRGGRDRVRRTLGREGPRHRRERRRQGSHRPSRPPAKRARPGAAVVAVNCAWIPEAPPRVRALRPRQGQLHRRAIATSVGQAPRWRIAARSSSMKIRRDERCACRHCCGFLENGEIQRVGANVAGACGRARASPRRTAICSVGSSRRTSVRDLTYRLNVIHIPIPPLRARRGGHPAFLAHYLARRTPPCTGRM